MNTRTAAEAPSPPPAPPATPASPNPAPPNPAPPSTAPTTPKEAAPTWKPARSGWLTVAVLLVVMAGGVLAVLAAWRLPPFTSTVQATEDAYVQGHTTVISPEVSGYVMTVPVEDYQQVHAGQVLVTIDPRSYQQQLARAEAQLASSRTALANNEQNIARSRADVAAKTAAIGSAQAQVRRADAELRRTRDLVRDGSVSPRENEANVATLSSARASLAQAEAALQVAMADVRSTEVNVGSLQASIQGAEAEVASAQLQVSRTEIHAPVDGELSDIGVKIGQYVTNGTELFFLVPPSRWVIANFKEAATHRMHPGQRAWFHVDALGGGRVDGHVFRMSPATGSQFSVLKPDNATGNFTKVPQRISVFISIDPGQPLVDRLKPGMSVEALVDTAG